MTRYTIGLVINKIKPNKNYKHTTSSDEPLDARLSRNKCYVGDSRMQLIMTNCNNKAPHHQKERNYSENKIRYFLERSY